MIVNHSQIEEFSIFNNSYYKKVVELYSQLDEVQVNAKYDKDTFYNNIVKMNSDDAFAYFYNSKLKYAEIIVSDSVCNRLGFTIKEKCAAIAHELGHIIKNLKGIFNQNIYVEIECDEIACRIGLANPMCTLLDKLSEQENYSENQIAQINLRKNFIKNFGQVLY